MLEGRTSDCLAIANTAILMRLMEELITKAQSPDLLPTPCCAMQWTV
jgi:hypothetical protein